MRNVLYVEDEDVNWFVAAPNLRDKYALCRARNAAEALAAMHAAQFDHILMDIQLASSGLDGINLTRVLRGTYPGFVSEIGKQQPEWTKDVPIIFVSAYTARYSREELIAARLTPDAIARELGVDSLGYLSLEGMLQSVPGGPHGFCHACFSGDYPTAPPTDPDKLRFGGGC
jgi:CheY-like chemotaxis protein